MLKKLKHNHFNFNTSKLFLLAKNSLFAKNNFNDDFNLPMKTPENMEQIYGNLELHSQCNVFKKI
jgi:hypothetical protein